MLLEVIQSFLEKFIAPVAEKIQKSKTISGISQGMMISLPVTVGGGIISLLGTLPWEPLTNLLKMIGLYDSISQYNVMGNWIGPLSSAFLIAYCYAKNEGEDPVPAGLFSFVSYLSLIPIQYDADGNAVQAISTYYLGGNGVFPAIIIAILTAKLYCFIMKKGLKIKLPDSVPSMVARSFEPMLGGIIVFGLVVIVKAIFAATPLGNIFDFVSTYITGPLVSFGATVPSIIFVYTMVNLFWFFGIHPMALTSLFTPILSQMIATSVQSMYAGTGIPYQREMVSWMSCTCGGTGCTFGLILVMLFFAKSNRYREITKVAAVPGLCNINEPLIFGLPIMMNPTMFIPMVTAPAVSIGIINLLANFGMVDSFNPIGYISMPWTVPTPIIAYFAGGFKLVFLFLVIIAAMALLYFPFFKILDMQACKEEAEEAAQAA